MRPPPPTITSNSPVNGIARRIFSQETTIMVAAIIFLIFVIIFVVLLHVYAKWFLLRARRRSATRSVAVPRILRPRLHQFHSFRIDAIFADDIATKGLDSSEISSMPLFVYKVDGEHKNGRLECVICLSFFEEEELGRKLPLCGHAFHVICIDTWLHSHSSCPICRHDLNPRPNDHQGLDHEGMLSEVHSPCPIRRVDSVTRSNNFHDLNPRTMNHEGMLGEVTLESVATSNLVETTIIRDKDTTSVDEVARPRDSASPSVPSSSVFVSESMKKTISRSRSERKVHPSMDLQEKFDAQVIQ